MPIEIRELVIKTSVSGGTQGNGASAPSESPSAKDSAAIIAACVDQVLAILKDKVER